MSDWTPKVGDRVMVGEHGPYRVAWVNRHGTACDLRDDEGRIVGVSIRASVLTPAPEPEPEEPPAPGALVRDGNGALRTLYVDLNARRWYLTRGGLGVGLDWPDLPRPITVILSDPAEVETLRQKVAEGQRLVEEMAPVLIERDALRANLRALGVEYDRVIAERDRFAERIDELERDYESAAHERDELQRRINKVVARGPILQGES